MPNYSIPSKLEFSLYSEVMHGGRVRIIFSDVIQENLVSSYNGLRVWGSTVSSPIGRLGPRHYLNARK